MKEQTVVDYIEKQLKIAGRYYINVHGSTYSKNGTPDFITMDNNNIFTGIEAKAPGKKPYANQWRRGIEILLSGGRFVIAQDDFVLSNFDNNQLPIIYVGSEIGESEYEAALLKVTCSSEIKLK